MPEQTRKYQDVYPEGVYTLEVLGNTMAQKKLENGEPDPSATPYAIVKAKVVSLKKTKNGAAAPSLILGGHRELMLFFTEKTIEKTRDFLKAAGFRGSDLRELKEGHASHKSLAGFTFDASCENEVYNKKTRDRFNILPVGGFDGKPKWREGLGQVSTAKMMGLNALWNSQNSGVSAAQHIDKAADIPPFAPDNAESATDASFNWD